MKTISKEQWQSLEELAAEGLLGDLLPQVAEKDIHVTDLLEALSTLEVRHAHFTGLQRGETERVDDGIRLVFAGGTCLSKAHDLINRMSEDVDIKVVLSEPSTPLKKDVSYRARLKALHHALAELLNHLDLHVPAEVDGRGNPQLRDVHRYYAVDAGFASQGSGGFASLRPALKLEVIHRHPCLEPQNISFGYLHERLAKLAPTKTVTMPCISVAETLAEKVLSLLRRCHWKWSGLQEGEMDPALVRHVYDVHRILQQRPNELATASDIFAALVVGDAQEFKDRDPAFELKPRVTLLETLAAARTSEELRGRYAERVLPLIYDGSAVSYETAFSSFESATDALISTLPS